MDVLMIAQFADVAGNSNNRFNSVASVLGRLGADVELVTSSFSHTVKQQRTKLTVPGPLYRITCVSEPGYPKNVSVRRILSHLSLSHNLTAYLQKRRRPDVIYCAVPSLDVADAARKYAEQHGVKFIIDVQDLWPEAFEMVLKPKRAAYHALAPLRSRAQRIYRAADVAVTVSETYSKKVAGARDDDSEVFTVYLGTDLDRFDRFTAERPPESGYHELVYIGTLGHSYDLPAVFDALRILKGRGQRMRLHLMGTGPFEDQWRRETADLREEVVFYGALDYPTMVSRLRGCDIAVNPIVAGAAQSITNKVGDYAAAGLPVVNSQECEEYRNLLDSYDAGINCDTNASSIANALEKLASEERLPELAKGSRLMAEDHFDRGVTYNRLGELILDGL